jgi:hypothetical protein
MAAARDQAERVAVEARRRLELALQNTEGGLWDWDLAEGASSLISIGAHPWLRRV